MSNETRKPPPDSPSPRTMGDDEEEEIVRRPRSRFQRQRDEVELKQVFRELGIDIDDVDSMKEARADLDYVRRDRLKQQTRISTMWTASIAAVVSALIGGLGVLISNIVHTGRIAP